MRKNRLQPGLFVIVASAAMAAHALLNATFPDAADLITDCFYAFWTLIALCVCLARGLRWPAMRSSWVLLSAALFLWFAATVMAAWAEFVQRASLKSATIADFFYFFYGVPILLAIAAPEDTRSRSLFFWLDGVQAAAAGFLAYIALYDVLPFSGTPIQPISVDRLVWIYDTENLLLLGLVTSRLMVSPRGTSEWRFLRVLNVFLGVYGCLATIYNHMVAAYTNVGAFDVLLDIPFAVLVSMVLAVEAAGAPNRDPRTRSPLALTIDNSQPVLLSFVLMLLSVWVARRHFNIAMAVIVGAFVVYGVRSTMLQSQFVRAQMALEDARDRLEELALQDGLTRIANRRCFNERLTVEWSRAHRTRTPLSLLLIDIDHFKRLNDTHGHIAGDECLIQVAATLREALNRPGDLLARYGGEEFVALLPETDEAGARNVAGRLQAALRESAPIPAIERQVTVSVGGSTCERDGSCEPERLVEAADHALYDAKQNGRNRVEFSRLCLPEEG